MDAAAGPLTYVARANAFEYEGTWRLGADVLELQGGPTAGPDVIIKFPYRDVRELRLSYAPTRANWGRYRCDIRMRSGQRVSIESTHYSGISNFESRAASYVPFVRELIERIAAANPSCRFVSGKRPLFYVLEHAFLLAAVAALIFVLGLVGGVGLSELVLVKLSILVCYIPVMILYTRRNWPGRFDPRNIPLAVLPSALA